ncbi:Aminoacyl tRNA synthase complex-interacting multifunctional protein 1 [Rhizopus azygosporus]|uniref:Aminoacyl tRNA synthase complex-interacting multifunctional protein 1 n=1 Tax=Rhizopus azygosporus TaxID=86630 RepID=A0A367IZT5_RHIAZ|nr:Aminoacyl tRNA synthase complex-interacting multifunctional protein 1 [Rhizopus azygosporus]
MSATLTIPEKSSQEIKLVYKFLQSKVETTTGKDLLLEVSGEKIDTPNAIVKYLVAQANKPELLGNNNEEQAQVDEWLSFATQGLRNAGKKEVVSHIEKKFNEHLSTHTFFVGNHLTIVDVVIFGILHSYTKNFKATTCPNTLRWFDLIQHMVIKANNLTEDFPLFEVNLDDVPEPAAPVVAKKDDKKKDDKKKDDKKQEKKDNKKDEKKPAAEGQKTEGGEKPKKEKKKAEKKPAAPAPAETDQPVVSRIDIRVGYIKSCKKHEGADSLYVEEIDVGEEEPRTIVSGLVRWYPIEQMENRYVLVLCNLKPASMRGVKSYGMVLCASAADGSAVELLGPIDPSKVKPGDRVYVEGQEGEPEKVLNPKKKYWETVQPELKTNDECIALYGDKPLLIKTASGEAMQCKVASVKNGGIK